jgi:hypothetical protein
MTFKNEAQLKKFLARKCTSAVNNTRKKVHKEFAKNLDKYYSEFTPEEYIRTGALHGSLDSTAAINNGNGAEAKVFFNAPSYQQGMMPLQHTPEHGRYGWATWSGEKVLDVAMTGGLPHGGYAGGTAIFTESMANLGDIESLLMQELKNQGL